MLNVIPKFKIIRKIAAIGDVTKWHVELNYISWYKESPKYEIRNWSADGKPGRGVTFSEEELRNLQRILNSFFSDEEKNVPVEPKPVCPETAAFLNKPNQSFDEAPTTEAHHRADAIQQAAETALKPCCENCVHYAADGVTGDCGVPKAHICEDYVAKQHIDPKEKESWPDRGDATTIIDRIGKKQEYLNIKYHKD